MKPNWYVADFLSLLAAADTCGYYTFVHDHRFDRDLGRGQKALRSMIASHFHTQPMVRLKFDSNQRFLAELDVTATREVNGASTVRLNLARMLLLPCVDPQAEFLALGNLVRAMRDQFTRSASADRRSYIQFTNEYDANGRVHGGMRIRSRTRSGTQDVAEDTDEQTEELLRIIRASPTLESWLLTVGKTLGNSGRFSWAILDESQLFRSGEEPTRLAIDRGQKWVETLVEEDEEATTPS